VDDADTSPDDTHMVVRCVLAFVAVAALGCGGESEATVDAKTIEVVPHVCDGRAYDPCTDTAGATDCMSGLVCRFYMQQNFTICSPLCDANTPCPPDQQGNPVTCNQNGRCRSNAPNVCTQ
jgi:hypothetical protein